MSGQKIIALVPAGWTGTCEALETVKKTYMVRCAPATRRLLPMKHV